LNDGAVEIDVVLNVGFVRGGLLKEAQEDLKQVCDACHSRGAICKVILEICLLTEEQIATASTLALDAGADFIKTSTGFSTGGATERAVSIMVGIAHPRGKRVKASGGIRDGTTAEKFIALGATRLGTSATINIIQDIKKMTGQGHGRGDSDNNSGNLY
jgi:deoxyribose-phosphate aldolase